MKSLSILIGSFDNASVMAQCCVLVAFVLSFMALIVLTGGEKKRKLGQEIVRRAFED